MNDIQQKIKILQGIYLFNQGAIKALEENDIEMHKKIITQYAKKNDGNDFYFNPKDTRLILSSLSSNEINQIFDYIFLKLLLESRDIKLNGQILKKLSDYLLPNQMQQILDNVEFNQINHNIYQAVMEYNPPQIKDHLKWLYFKDNNPKLRKHTIARFKPLPFYKELESILSEIKINELVNNSYPIVLPHLDKIIYSFIQNGDHND